MARRCSRRVVTVFGGVVAVALAGAAVPLASGAFASSGTAADRVVVCESGTVSSGGVETSSAVAVRLPGSGTDRMAQLQGAVRRQRALRLHGRAAPDGPRSPQ